MKGNTTAFESCPTYLSLSQFGPILSKLELVRVLTSLGAFGSRIMLLVGRYGTTKPAVRSPGLQLQHLRPLHRHYTTTSSRLNEKPSGTESGPSASPENHRKSYAVLGGGITGLSAAYFLTHKFPNAKVTIYEASKRLGGWADSEIVEVDGEEVLFEWGPRSLRPDYSGPGKITIQLVRYSFKRKATNTNHSAQLYELGLAEDIVATHRDHPAARNRFIYYPDHLVRMPAPYAQTGPLTNFFLNVRTLLTEPIFKGIIGGLLSEPTVKTRASHVEDESVGNFVQRRFGITITDNMLSALFHGIYAGDIYNLSARTLLPKLWYLETRDPEAGGILPELFELMIKSEQIYSRSDVVTAKASTHFASTGEPTPEILRSLISNMRRQSVYTFTKGIGHLISALESRLRQNPNVTIHNSKFAGDVTRDADSGDLIVHGADLTEDANATKSTSKKHNHVISTLPPQALIQISSNGTADSASSAIASAISSTATVMVVNLYYANPSLTSPYRGFGYLIPQSIPMEENPERALGVIFASETSGPRGHRPPSDEADLDLPTRWQINNQDSAPGTKLTVMLGGHWWADWAASDLPSPETAIEMAKAVLERHMGITEPPRLAKARLQVNAIPQYRVGHRKAMAAMHDELQWYGGRLRVAGPAWQGGVGVNDCVRRAWEVVEDLGLEDNLTSGGGWKTGIEEYTREEEWILLGRDGVEWKEKKRQSDGRESLGSL